MPSIQLQLLHDDPRNANVCNEETLEKIRRNIERSGLYPSLIIRPRPKKKGHYLILDGHHRKIVLEKLGYEAVNCEIWDTDEQGAQLALATLNRLRGEDEPRKRAQLIQSLMQSIPVSNLTAYIPESEKQVSDLLALLKLDWEETQAQIKKQIEQEQALLPQPFTCMIASVDFPDVEKALLQQDGKDKGEKLVALCRMVLNQENGDASK